MSADMENVTLQLQAGQVLHLRNARGLTVRSLEGVVWITQDGDGRDIVLTGGEAFTLDRRGLAVVGALGSARIGIGPGWPAASLPDEARLAA